MSVWWDYMCELICPCVHEKRKLMAKLIQVEKELESVRVELVYIIARLNVDHEHDLQRHML